MNVLDARNLQFSYGDRPVLRDVSIQLEAGQIVALLGPNGAGKSTLLHVLLGQLHASGSIQWLGRDLASWSRRELARAITYLPQSPVVEDEQLVLDVLRTGRAPYWGAFGIESDADVQAVSDVARQLELADLLSGPMAHLSGGQRQRVFIGRCLVQRPRAMLLDEPSTFLDLRHQFELMHLMRTLARQGMAVLMASHDLNLAAAFADRLVLVDRGGVAADGPPERVLDPDLLSRIYEIPMRRVDPGPPGPPIVFPKLSTGS